MKKRFLFFSPYCDLTYLWMKQDQMQCYCIHFFVGSLVVCEWQCKSQWIRNLNIVTLSVISFIAYNVLSSTKKNTYLTKLTKWLVWMLWNLCHLYTSRMLCQKQIEPIIITDAVYIWYNTDAQSTSDILHMLESANNRTIGRGNFFCFDASGLNMFEQSLKGPQLQISIYF